MNPSRIFILRPVATSLMMLAIFLAGVVAYRLLPISALPEDQLRIVLPRIAAHADLPVDVFDRSGSMHLASGSVVTVDNQIDPGTGTVRVKAVFDNRDHALFPSQFVNVQLLADTQKGQIVAPAAAVQQGPQGPFVFAIRNGTAQLRPVTVGAIDGERASIAKGLAVGDVVVTDGFDRLRPNSRVEIAR